jgi:hypothetical protein
MPEQPRVSVVDLRQEVINIHIGELFKVPDVCSNADTQKYPLAEDSIYSVTLKSFFVDKRKSRVLETQIVSKPLDIAHFSEYNSN